MPRHVALAIKPRRLDGVKQKTARGNMSRHSTDTLQDPQAVAEVLVSWSVSAARRGDSG